MQWVWTVWSAITSIGSQLSAGGSLVALRVGGGVFGVALSIYAFNHFRRHLIRRSEFLLFSFTALALVVISAAPQSVNVLADMLSLRDREFGRLITLLIISQMLIWVLVVRIRSRDTRQAQQFDRLVRRLAQRDFALAGGYKAIRPIEVIIPALNEAENLAVVLPRIPPVIEGYPVGVLVVDDGSTDDTMEVARSLGAAVASNPINRGGGAALRVGFDIAMSGSAGIIVTMDADGQHMPEELQTLISPILADELDFVIGSRVLGRREKDSAIRWMGVHVFSFIINRLTGLHVTDSSSGFRAFRADALRRVLMTQDQFHTAEAIIDASKRRLRIGEVPITVLRRHSGTSKKGKSLSYGANYSKTVVSSWLRD